MKYLLTIITCFIVSISSAQTPEWFELGTTWSYKHRLAFDWFSQEYLAEFQVTELTEYNGQACAKIEATDGNLMCLSVEPPYYVYESNDSIFYSSSTMSDYELAYVFQGTDEWIFTVVNQLYVEDYLVTVLENQVITMDGVELDVITVNYENLGDGFNEIYPLEIDIIQFVGSTSFFPIPFGNMGFCDGAYNIELLCFSSPSFDYVNPDFASCTLSRDEIVKEKDILLYPNPTDDRINWVGTFESISIFDPRGILIHRTNLKANDNVLNVDFLQSGIYSVLLEGKESAFHSKLLVQ